MTQFNLAQSEVFQGVSKEELLEPIFDKFPESNSTVLFRKETIYFENNDDTSLIQKNEIHERIKIYNKGGFDQVAKIINLFNNKDVIDLEGAIYNLVEDNIIAGTIKKDSIAETYGNSQQTTYKYVFPNLREGCIIEYRYVLKSECCLASNIVLQKDIPIKKLEVEIFVLKSLNYKTTLNPKSTIIPKIESSARVQNFNTELKVGEKFDDLNQEKDEEEIITITNSDIPPFHEEPYAINDSYLSKIVLEPVQLEPRLQNSIDLSWDEVARSIYNSIGFADQIDDFDMFTEDLESIITENEDDREKAVILFNFIKLKMKWNGLEGYFINKGVKQAYMDGSGNVADINLTLLALLRSAGLNANPVLVSTLDNGIASSPTPKGFNYVICAVHIDGEIMLLDASDEFSSPNILPLKALNWQGKLVKYDGTSMWIDLIPKDPSTKKTTLNAKIHSDFSLIGNVKIQYSDYQASSYRNQNKTYSDKDLINSIKKGSFGLNVYDFKSKSESDFLNKINQSYEFKSNSLVKKIGDKLYFSPLLFLESGGNPFIDDKRQFPVNFMFPFENEYKINIILPEGYELESFPRNEIIQFNDNDGEFNYFVRETGKILQFIISLKVNKTLVLPEEYQDIRQFYKSIFDKKNEKVILRKVKYENKRPSKNSR